MRICAAIPAFIFAVVLTPRAGARPQQAETKPAPSDQQAPGATSSTDSVISAPQPHIDPTKEADIRKLMQVTGSAGIAKQLMDNMEKNLKPVMSRSLPPGEYRDQLIDLFFQKFQAKADPQQLAEMMVPIYDKYLSDEDINGLIRFYSTPLGQKALSVLPQLTVEAQGQGQKWGENLGRQSMIEVLSEHPELAKALQDAQRAATQH